MGLTSRRTPRPLSWEDSGHFHPARLYSLRTFNIAPARDENSGMTIGAPMGRFAKRRLARRIPKRRLGTTGRGRRKKIGEFGREGGRISPVSKNIGETQNRAVAQPLVVGRMMTLFSGLGRGEAIARFSAAPPDVRTSRRTAAKKEKRRSAAKKIVALALAAAFAAPSFAFARENSGHTEKQVVKLQAALHAEPNSAGIHFNHSETTLQSRRIALSGHSASGGFRAGVGMRPMMSFYPDEREFINGDPVLDKMFSGVVQIQCYLNNRTQAFYSTGSVISRNLVLTAAHAFKKTPKHKILQDCRILTGDRNDRDGWDEQTPYKIKAVYSEAKRFDEISDPRKDWAIIKIKGTFPNSIKPLKIIQDIDPNYKIRVNLAHVSYGIDDALYRGQRQLQKECEAKTLDENYIDHDCDNFQGSSGAPLFLMRDEGGKWVPYITGIHVADSDDESIHNYKNPAPKWTGDKTNRGLSIKGESILNGIRKYRGY